MEIDGDTIEVMEEGDEDDDAEIYAEEVGIEFNDGSADGFTTTRTKSAGPVTIYRLIKLEHAEALGISLREGSVTTPNQKTKIITRNIIKLGRPPRKMVLAQKNAPVLDTQDNADPSRRFVCRLCEKAFRHASHLKRHINSHTGERLYDCQQCGKRFLDASTLCRHRRTHTGDRPYACRVCEKRFGTLGSLRRHVTVHDQEARPHLCFVCGKRFPDQSSYRKHRLIHVGIRPHTCDVCGKAFVHVGDLNGHKKVHADEQPWECQRCGKRFSKQSNCMRHSLIHDGGGECAFSCHLCGVSYNFQGSLTRHLLTHRKRERSPRRPTSQKVVVLTGVDRSMVDADASRLTLRQIKYLVRENKINFDGEEGGVPVGEATGKGDREEETVTSEETASDTAVSKERSDIKGTIIIKHVGDGGDVNYIIEEA